MQLSLSSAAAPDAALADLVAACARRGLAALELVEGHAHGVCRGSMSADRRNLGIALREAHITLCGLRLDAVAEDQMSAAARLAADLGAPIIMPGAMMRGALLARAARAFAEHGAKLLLAHDSDPGLAEALRYALMTLPGGDAVGLAWEFRPESDDQEGTADVLEAAGDRLEYIRLHGGGPESARQTGQGVGALMARLTLARYRGPLVLAPSDPRYHYAWEAWLGRAGGWGCGSKQQDASLVILEHSTHTAGSSR